MNRLVLLAGCIAVSLVVGACGAQPSVGDELPATPIATSTSQPASPDEAASIPPSTQPLEQTPSTDVSDPQEPSLETTGASEATIAGPAESYTVDKCDPAMNGNYYFDDGTVGILPMCIQNYELIEGNPNYPFCGDQICVGSDGNPVATVKESNAGELIYCDHDWCYHADGTPVSMAEMPNPEGRPNHANDHAEACEWGYLPPEDC
ncbi:hypothetical protein IEU95_15975 [Hoyosella rhizosphaerae]|uniref:Secreted protein n=1 Tax=Hoyosella rhizosphaerae TaxID=1755582 RepID=A0A916UJ24_9ACTN|nr:hypothetical protein [Hoyosella rhizosphaerae]MBN4928333.1 hypothetical protein [Hoyosella rhizosphaerae]GGC74143.1 hypothetical protein GCM10011410_29210 [Hoyosella rhizosphaerae]